MQTLRDTGKQQHEVEIRTSKDIRIRGPQTVWYYGISPGIPGNQRIEGAKRGVFLEAIPGGHLLGPLSRELILILRVWEHLRVPKEGYSWRPSLEDTFWDPFPGS